MSDGKSKEFVDQLGQWVERDTQLQSLEEEIREKKIVLDKTDVERRFSEHQRDLRLKKEVESFDLNQVKASPDTIRERVKDRLKAVDFIFPETRSLFLFAPRSIVLVAAPTGNGKSTMTAAITAPLIRQGKRVLVLSNEEAVSDVRTRISCLLLGLSFGEYNAGRLTDAEVNKIADKAEEVEKQLIVLGNQGEVDRRVNARTITLFF